MHGPGTVVPKEMQDRDAGASDALTFAGGVWLGVRFAYVVGESWDLDDLVATLTRLWANALRIS